MIFIAILSQTMMQCYIPEAVCSASHDFQHQTLQSKDLLCFRHTCTSLQLSRHPLSQVFSIWIDRTIRESARHVGQDKVVSSEHLLSINTVAECGLFKSKAANRKDEAETARRENIQDRKQKKSRKTNGFIQILITLIETIWACFQVTGFDWGSCTMENGRLVDKVEVLLCNDSPTAQRPVFWALMESNGISLRWKGSATASLDSGASVCATLTQWISLQIQGSARIGPPRPSFHRAFVFNPIWAAALEGFSNCPIYLPLPWQPSKFVLLPWTEEEIVLQTLDIDRNSHIMLSCVF